MNTAARHIVPQTFLSEKTVSLAAQLQTMGFTQRQIFSGLPWQDYQSPRFEADALAMSVMNVAVDASTDQEVEQFLMVLPSAALTLADALEMHIMSPDNMSSGRQCISAIYHAACLQLLVSLFEDFSSFL